MRAISRASTSRPRSTVKMVVPDSMRRGGTQALRQGLRDEVLDADLRLNAVDPQRAAESFRDARPQLDDGCVHAVPSYDAQGELPGAPCAVPGALVRGRTGNCPCSRPVVV